jgi:hypothetical protein
MRESAELTKGEVAGVDRYDIEEVSLRLGVTETFDSLDLFNRHFHRDKISAADSGSTMLGQRPDTPGALAPCSGFYLRVRRVVPPPFARPGGSPQVIWVHQAREGKVGENPLTYREALRKEKVRKNLCQDVGCLCVPLTPKTAEWQAFISHPLWRAIQRANNGET